MKKNIKNLTGVLVILSLIFTSCSGSLKEVQNNDLAFESAQFQKQKKHPHDLNAVDEKAETPENFTLLFSDNVKEELQEKNTTSAKTASKKGTEFKKSVEEKLEVKAQKFIKSHKPVSGSSSKLEPNYWAIVGLVNGILGVLVGLFGGVGNFINCGLAIAFGIIAKSELKKKGVEDQSVKSMANWSIILGIAGLVIGVIVTILWFFIGIGFAFLPLVPLLLGY